MSNFAQNLAAILQEQNLKRIDLARAVGVHPTSVTNWLEKDAAPRRAVLNRVGDVLGYDPSSLLTTCPVRVPLVDLRPDEPEESPTLPTYTYLKHTHYDLTKSPVARALAVVEAAKDRADPNDPDPVELSNAEDDLFFAIFKEMTPELISWKIKAGKFTLDEMEYLDAVLRRTIKEARKNS